MNLNLVFQTFTKLFRQHPFSAPKYLNDIKNLKLKEAHILHSNGRPDEAQILYKEFVAAEIKAGKKQINGVAANRAALKSWPFFVTNSPDIAYLRIPKCACTSIGNLLFQIEEGKPFEKASNEINKKGVHSYFLKNGTYHDVNIFGNHFKFTVIRDPIKRFISGYRNRVIYHNALLNLVEAKHIHKVPTLNEFALNLEFYFQRNLEIEHHFAPQEFYLNGDLSFLDAIYKIEDFAEVEKKLSQISKRTLTPVVSQTGGPEIKLGDLNKRAFRKLIDFYESDYKLLHEFYSIEEISAEYLSQRKKIV